MPPHVTRKRLRESPDPTVARPGARAINSPARRKATLYDDLDASSTARSSAAPRSALADIEQGDSDSSLTSLSDSDFEDVPIAKRQKVADESSEDEDVQFEDVTAPETPALDAPVPSGDLELTLKYDRRIPLISQHGDKKGPTKVERKMRNGAHCGHVMSLLWHNAIRNAWLNDPEVQAILVSQIPHRIWPVIERFRRVCKIDGDTKSKEAQNVPEKKRKPRQSRGLTKGSNKIKPDPEAVDELANEAGSRDWGTTATKLDETTIDMSQGDPLFGLIAYLATWWKTKFKTTAPGLRKVGYLSLKALDKFWKSYEAGPHDPDRFGERIEDLAAFRIRAAECSGSRDVGAQLFTALLRGLGLETRMVANIQTLGFGFNKFEEADPEAEGEGTTSSSPKRNDQAGDRPDKTKVEKRGNAKKPKTPAIGGNRRGGRRAAQTSHSVKGAKTISISDSDDLEREFGDTDDESVVELPVTVKSPKKALRRYDVDLEYPHYWSEILSPATKKYLCVDAVVKHINATNRELVEQFEPRGAKAERARQIMAYVVAFSPDGTAKDVTVRYLKRQLWPGRTKGLRYPIEKIPIYNRHGKVKRYEERDWFKQTMSSYVRGSQRFPITEVDELEDSTDLRPAKPEKKVVKEGEETLQYYKQSKDFVLARHLKREEALRPGSKPVKTFRNKGKGSKSEEEDVYLRKDVLAVKSAETWHKQGRAPIPGEVPLKTAPYRAATTNRRREIQEAEAATGQKVLQGLFSYDQTEWIIPPPIENGVIPKNQYGNIDMFAEHMCPKGAVHIPFRGTVKVCKRLQIDYAEAVVDFEFGNRMAVPVIQGVVIAQEYHDEVMKELDKDEKERARKEDEKRRKATLGRWRKFMMGLRIVARIRLEYGEIGEGVSVFGHVKDRPRLRTPPEPADEETGGGFLPEGYEEDGEDEGNATPYTSGFFPVADEDDDQDGNLIMEDDLDQTELNSVAGDQAEELSEQDEEQQMDAQPVAPARPRRSGRQRRVVVEACED